MDLILEVNKIYDFKSDSIQIDSFFPNIIGANFKNFFNEIKDISYFTSNFENFIDNNKKYHLIVESAYNITSQISKKHNS